MNCTTEQKCKSKYSSQNIKYNCSEENEDNIKIYKDDFSVTVTKEMFDTLFEII